MVFHRKGRDPQFNQTFDHGNNEVQQSEEVATHLNLEMSYFAHVLVNKADHLDKAGQAQQNSERLKGQDRTKGVSRGMTSCQSPSLSLHINSHETDDPLPISVSISVSSEYCHPLIPYASLLLHNGSYLYNGGNTCWRVVGQPHYENASIGNQ